MKFNIWHFLVVAAVGSLIVGAWTHNSDLMNVGIVMCVVEAVGFFLYLVF